jgi:hypothetical protein
VPRCALVVDVVIIKKKSFMSFVLHKREKRRMVPLIHPSIHDIPHRSSDDALHAAFLLMRVGNTNITQKGNEHL